MDEELRAYLEAMEGRLVGKINVSNERILDRLTEVEREVRNLRSEQPAMRAYVGARAGETEILMQRLFDRLNDRLDQSERSIEERLRKLEGG
jgi:hypothetical protein